MIIAANFIYDADPGGCVLIDLDKLPPTRHSASFKAAVKKAFPDKSCVIKYDVAQSKSIFSAFVKPPQMVEAVIDFYVE